MLVDSRGIVKGAGGRLPAYVTPFAVGWSTGSPEAQPGCGSLRGGAPQEVIPPLPGSRYTAQLHDFVVGEYRSPQSYRYRNRIRGSAVNTDFLPVNAKYKLRIEGIVS